MEFPLIAAALLIYGGVTFLERQPLMRAKLQRKMAILQQKQEDSKDFEYVRDDYSDEAGLYNEYTDDQLLSMGIELDTTLGGPRLEEVSAEFKPVGWGNYQQTAQYSSNGRHVPYRAFKLQ
jgi:hypothetical protein